MSAMAVSCCIRYPCRGRFAPSWSPIWERARACTTTGRYYFVPTAAAQANLDAVGVEFGGCRIVKDFSEVKGDVTQISAISAGDMNIPAREILPLWQDRIGAAITGEHWLDFTAAGKDKVRWGHGERYYNRKYADIEFMDKLSSVTSRKKKLQQVYKDLGLDASNQAKVKTICGGEALEYVKKYLPNSYAAMLDILKGVK